MMKITGFHPANVMAKQAASECPPHSFKSDRQRAEWIGITRGMLKVFPDPEHVKVEVKYDKGCLRTLIRHVSVTNKHMVVPMEEAGSWGTPNE